MYYIFNENGECVASCNYEPDADDLASRNEIAVVSEESYDIGKIKLVNGVIIEVVNEPTLEELKVTKLSEIGVWTERKITGGFVSECSGEIVTYDSDRDTQNTVSSDLNTIYLAPEKFGKDVFDMCLSLTAIYIPKEGKGYRSSNWEKYERFIKE